jgi:uncharacterized protein with ACT and thioredoxin-like domain
MAFTLRMVVVDSFGKSVAIVETRRLTAVLLSGAKKEADRHSRRIRNIKATGLEIVDQNGTVVARRSYGGKRVSYTWSS